MIRFGQREFAVPVWLWVAAPFAALLYVGIDLHTSGTVRYLAYSEPDSRFLQIVRYLAVGSIAGFLMTDLVRRARMPWYGLPLVVFVSIAIALAATDWVSIWLNETSRLIVGLAINAASAARSTGAAGFILFGSQVLAIVLLAVGAALFVTIAGRLIGGLPLLSRATWRDFFINLGSATIWIGVALAGYLIIRFSFGVHMGRRDAAPSWLPMTAAIAAALAATLVQLALARRSRAVQAASGHVKIWLLALLCVAGYVYRPDLLGVSGIRFYLDQLRPALRAVHVLPTPALTVAGYTVNVPYHDVQTMVSPKPPAQAAYVSVPLPADYGLTNEKHTPRVTLYRRDVQPREVASFWEGLRKSLDEAQVKEPAVDTVLFSTNRLGGVVLRSAAYPGVDIQLWSLNPATPRDQAEAALRRFMSERVTKS